MSTANGPNPDPSLGQRLRATLNRNLAAVRRHRPALWRILSSAPTHDRYQVLPTPSGALSLVDLRGPRGPVVLSPGNDPLDACRDALRQLQPAHQRGDGVILGDLGDGYLVKALAQHPPKLFMDRQQAIWLIEPDVGKLLSLMLIHDFAGPDGPIEQTRFNWYVGHDWAQRLQDDAHQDLTLTQPTVQVFMGQQQALRDQLQAIARSLSLAESQWARHIAQRDAALTADDYACAIEQRITGRQPRMLLLTSRFTTVLQYVARDTALTLEQMGWRCQTLIESAPHQVITSAHIRRAIATFEPDVVFMLDHLRAESAGLFPTGLPMIAWIQDHLPALMTRQAGRSVTPRDFVMTFAKPLLVQQHDYPARQCIEVSLMVTRPSPQPSPRSSPRSTDGPDLVYTSHVSGSPQTLALQMQEQAPADVYPIARDLARALIDLYRTGGNLPGVADVSAVVDRVIAEHGGCDPEHAQWLHQRAWNPLNITLYRQQALHWAADAADALGLTLAIYGRGWEHHLRFGPYARGPVEPGEPLRELTRSAKINLNLEPYACFTHHRLLDGLSAGGFFLVRDHPAHALLAAFGRRAADNTLDEAFLADWRRRAACVSFDGRSDPVDQAHAWIAAQVLPADGSPPMPGLEAVTFTDAAGCRRLMERYLNDEPARRALTDRMWAWARERLTFEATFRRVLREMAQRLRHERNDLTPHRAAG